MKIPNVMPNPGEERDRKLVASLRQWNDNDLTLTIGVAATLLAVRWKMSESGVMERLTELAKLQETAESEAARRAMLN